MALFRTDHRTLSDERLMELIVRGDERAFGALYDRYQRKLIGYFARMLWNDRERAQDLLQELFTKIARQPGSYDPARPFSTWLYSVANNMCKNEYRREAVRKAAVPHLRAEHDGVASAAHGGLPNRRVVELLGDPSRRAAIGAAARDCVLRAYSWSAHLRTLDWLLDAQGTDAGLAQAVQAREGAAPNAAALVRTP